QCLDRAAFVHRAVTLRHSVERQGQVEDLARIDLPVLYQVDQLGQIAAQRRGAAVEMNMREEQLLAVEMDPVRNADVADKPPGRVERMACIIGSCVPTHSSTESAPTP